MYMLQTSVSKGPNCLEVGQFTISDGKQSPLNIHQNREKNREKQRVLMVEWPPIFRRQNMHIHAENTNNLSA